MADEVAILPLMHDFARYLLGDRLIIVDRGVVTPPSSSSVNDMDSAYLALVSNLNAKKLDMSSILPASILALRFEDCKEMELGDDAFAFAKYLRLLDLSGCYVKKLPTSIRHLKQLRYLNAPGIEDELFPRPITGLHELRYLCLRGSRLLSNLTEAFLRFGNLLHLDLSDCLELKALPESFGRLWRLEHLDMSRSGIVALPESFVWLRNLSHLDLAGCSGLQALPESFGSIGVRLRHLDLARCSALKKLPESFGSLGGLRHLDLSLSGCSKLEGKLLSGVFGCFHELRHLDLSGFSELEYLPPMPRALRHLNLSGCSGLVGMSYGTSFPNLVHLDLSGCSRLESLEYVLPKSVNLVHLDLSGCSSLKRANDPWNTSFPFFFPKLRYLDLSGCKQLTKNYKEIMDYVKNTGGTASGPDDASLKLSS